MQSNTQSSYLVSLHNTTKNDPGYFQYIYSRLLIYFQTLAKKNSEDTDDLIKEFKDMKKCVSDNGLLGDVLQVKKDQAVVKVLILDIV